jgi:hypothetical protein
MGIKPARHPVNGAAFGLTPDECARIEKRLEPETGFKAAIRQA